MSLEIIGTVIVLILLVFLSIVLLASVLEGKGGFFRIIFGIVLLYFSAQGLIRAIIFIVFGSLPN